MTSLVDIDISDLPDCVVTDVRVSFRVTAANLAAVTGPGNTFELHSASSITYKLIQVSSALTGTTVGGSACGSLNFQDNGTDFSLATPPYTGNFRPAGQPDESGGTDQSFDVFKGQNANGNWHLHLFLNGSVTVECFRLQLTVT